MKIKVSLLNRNFNEDNLKTMARFPDGLVDLILTSPPYADLRRYDGFNFDLQKMLPEMIRVLKPGGVIVWVVGDKTENGSELLIPFHQAIAFKRGGLRVHDTMLFTAERPPKTHRRYEQKFEFMFVFSKGTPKTFNPILEVCKGAGESRSSKKTRQDSDQLGERSAKGVVGEFKLKGNIWNYHVGGRAETKIASEHPAIFPLALAQDQIVSWTDQEDLVYDPFHGSGTTAVAARKLGRNWIGSEISTRFHSLIERRLAE